MPLIYKEVKVTRKVLTGFECSQCGDRHDADEFIEMQEMMHFKDTGGYGSIWGDGVTYEITLCQKCAYKLFNGIATIHDA